jgi:hypothetical protein
MDAQRHERSIHDCIYKAKWGMLEHMDLLKDEGLLPIPLQDPDPQIVIQNDRSLVAA